MTKPIIKSDTILSEAEAVRPSAREHLNWQTVADAAIALADEVGLDSLSLRAVAARLGVTPMALYKHIHDKAELQAIVVTSLLERSLRDLEFAESDDWRTIVRACCYDLHRSYSLHPNLIHIFIQFPFHGKSQRRGRQMLDALQAAGFDADEAVEQFALLCLFIVGNVMVAHHFAKGRRSAGFDRAQRSDQTETMFAEEPILRETQPFDRLLEVQLDMVAQRAADRGSRR